MVPKITSGGASFQGAFRYYLHDKGAETSSRVAWTQTVNLRTPDASKAWKSMAYTAMAQERLKEASGQSRAGRKLEKPVFAFSLAWHPEQSPTREHMLETARKAIGALGLSDHEAVIVAHRDEPQKHIHVIVNRVHPLTGMAGDVRNSKRKLSDFARDYERADGKIYCQRREENHRQRAEGQPTRYADPHIAEAWASTDCGKAFVAALAAKGYRLAQGRKRLVIIDPHGKSHNPTRHLDGVRAADFAARLRDLDLTRLPDADAPGAPAASAEEMETAAARAHQRAEFEAKARAQRESLAQKQSESTTALALQHHRRFVSAKKKVAAFYGLPEKKKAVLTQREKVRQAPWWKRLLGIAQKERQTLTRQVRDYHEALELYRGKIAGIRQQHEQARTEMRTTHDRERRELESAMARQHAALDAPERIAPQREHWLDASHDFNAAAQNEEPQKTSDQSRVRRRNSPTKSRDR